jgi:ABC-type transport system involved in multi-copper enzyme maturation permease subunit
MKKSKRREGAVARKELREYRRQRSVVLASAIFPLIFLIQPLFIVFLVPSVSAATLEQWHLLLYMLAIPVLTPTILAAYAVAGERQQGTLEPVLTTPLPSEEFLLGKALAALVPSVVVAYGVYAIFLACVLVLAPPDVASAIFKVPDIIAQLLLTPLLAGWSIWVGIAISVRSSDVRVAQQLGLLANIPLILITSLIAFDTIRPTPGLAIGFTSVLLIGDGLGWRIVAPMFDRERLVAGAS